MRKLKKKPTKHATTILDHTKGIAKCSTIKKTPEVLRNIEKKLVKMNRNNWLLNLPVLLLNTQTRPIKKLVAAPNIPPKVVAVT